MKRQYSESEKAKNNGEGLLCFKLEKTDIFSDLITNIKQDFKWQSYISSRT